MTHLEIGNMTTWISEVITLAHTVYLSNLVRMALCILCFLPMTLVAQVSSPPCVAGGVDDKAAHKFWDGSNILLHSLNTASKIADFHSTERMLRRGGHELNPLLRTRPARIGIILGFGTGGHVLIAWILHRTGHHKLERWFMVPSIGASGTAAGWNYKRF